ncbi:MAG: response regulator [Chloroflexota bacterium]|nr:response regulator [Chloroflexota bacterium]
MALYLIALVEDDPHILNLLNDLFSEEGYRTLAISKGAAAYATIAREQPDVIILDLWLEQQGAGWAIYDQLRANDATTDIPIIICSADVGTVRARALWTSRHTVIRRSKNPSTSQPCSRRSPTCSIVLRRCQRRDGRSSPVRRLLLPRRASVGG